MPLRWLNRPMFNIILPGEVNFGVPQFFNYGHLMTFENLRLPAHS